LKLLSADGDGLAKYCMGVDVHAYSLLSDQLVIKIEDLEYEVQRKTLDLETVRSIGTQEQVEKAVIVQEWCDLFGWKSAALI
jgi:hypothetical protein